MWIVFFSNGAYARYSCKVTARNVSIVMHGSFPIYCAGAQVQS